MVKRGQTIYIPCVIPETACLAIAFLLTLVASILFFVAAGTLTWRQEEVIYKVNGYTNASYKFEFGVRRVRVDWCQVDTVFDSLHKPNYCGGEDVYYSTCSRSNDYCADAPAGDLAFYGASVLLMGLFCILSILAQFLRRYMHFLWHLPVSILSPFATLMTGLAVGKVDLSKVVQRTEQIGYKTEGPSHSLNCAIVGVLFVWAALAFMIFDFCWQKRKDNQRKRPDASAYQSSGSADAQPSQQQPPAPGAGSSQDTVTRRQEYHTAGGV